MAAPGESASAAAARLAALLESGLPESAPPGLALPGLAGASAEFFEGPTVAASSLASGTASLAGRSDPADFGERPTIVLSVAAEVTPLVFGSAGAAGGVPVEAAEGVTSSTGAALAEGLLVGTVLLDEDDDLEAAAGEPFREPEESLPPLLLEPLPPFSGLASGVLRATVSG